VCRLGSRAKGPRRITGQEETQMKKNILAILVAAVIVLTLAIPMAAPAWAANPNTRVTISPPSGQVPANQPFILTITEQNTGNEVLTNVSVNVTSILATTNINYVLGYPVYPPTSGDGLTLGDLDIGETWTWNIPGVVLNPGVTVISAYGHALDQLGNPIEYPLYPDEYYAVDLTGITLDNDLGDAPDSSNHALVTMNTGYTPNNQANFPTVYDPPLPGPAGPYHISPKGFAWLGPQVSFEGEADTGPDQDGLNNINPPGSANQDLFDDSITSVFLPDCQLTRFQFSATNASTTTTVTAYINVWFDWTHDGDWDDQPRCAVDPSTDALAPEWAVQNYAVTLAPGFNSGLLTPFFRSHNPPGQTVWMRISLTDVHINAANNGGPFSNPADLGKGGSGPAGGYQFGETEDYLVIPSVGIITPSLPDGVVRAAYSENLEVINGVPPYKWSIKPGTRLPSGLILKANNPDSSMAMISGKPTTPGEFSFTVQATDSTKAAAEMAFTVFIYPEVSLVIPKLPVIEMGAVFPAWAPIATGGNGSYTWEISKGILPPELELDTATGMISGTPGSASNFPITLTVKDTLGGSASKPLTLKVLKPLSIAVNALPLGDIGVAYKSTTLKATGGTGKYTWSLAEGTLPVGLTLNSGGLISGTPLLGNSGEHVFVVRVSDGPGAATQPISMTINGPLVVSPLPEGVAGEPYSHVLSATGGSGGYKFSTAGALPSGLKFTAASGTIAGTPVKGGTYRFIVKATDSLKGTVTQIMTLNILSAVTIDLKAQNIAFDKKSITVPSGARVTINFNNQDAGIPHNFSIYTDSTAAGIIFRGDVVIGPAVKTYTFIAPADPGAYFFRCDVHPDIMNGQFIVQ
jgi:hypothetical protein